MLRQQRYIKVPATAEQRIQDCPSFIRHGEQLSGLFLFQFNAERGKPTARRLLRKRGEDITNDRLRTVKVLRTHNRMRDITSASPGYQNLRTKGFGSIQHDETRCPTLDSSMETFGGKNGSGY